MNEASRQHLIPALKRKWIRAAVFSGLLVSLGTGLLLAVLSNKLYGWSGWSALLYACIFFAALLFMVKPWLISEKALTQLLDKRYAQLEESSSLLLRPFASLNRLERLQYHKTGHQLSCIPAPLNIARQLVVPAVILLMMVASAAVLNSVSFHRLENATGSRAIKNATAPETVLPQVASVTISITPPAYTGKGIRRQHVFNMQAEEGSVINWQLQTSIATRFVKFIFNDSLQISLQPTDSSRRQWQLRKRIDSTGFYQLSIDGKISTLYKIEAIQDRPPSVLLQSPKQYTTIDFGAPRNVHISGTITDDYGIKDAFISATVASGSGEAVKFKEQRISLPGFAASRLQYQLQQQLSLTSLGMQPGDELYFYVQATDMRQQQTRSDMYIVHLPDTAQLMSLEGMSNSLDLKPEYFRSERQIIIETEQLLKDKDTIGAEAFKNRSNNLGIDQKLLRLRYGKFLGDETASGENDAHDLDNVSNFSDADKIIDAFTDKHDNAEDASFYEPETKKQLRSILAEMWKAEIPLRTFSPQAALPFEYKALRLLKDLQEKSRAYVAKTNFKTTPLDPKKRLTGDLSKIDALVLQKDIKQSPGAELSVRNALAVLEAMKLGSRQNASAQILQQANGQLHQKAIQQPARYLAAVAAMQRIVHSSGTAEPIDGKDIILAEQGLQQLLSPPAPLPSAAPTTGTRALSKQYFRNLQKKQP